MYDRNLSEVISYRRVPICQLRKAAGTCSALGQPQHQSRGHGGGGGGREVCITHIMSEMYFK